MTNQRQLITLISLGGCHSKEIAWEDGHQLRCVLYVKIGGLPFYSQLKSASCVCCVKFKGNSRLNLYALNLLSIVNNHLKSYCSFCRSHISKAYLIGWCCKINYLYKVMFRGSCAAIVLHVKQKLFSTESIFLEFYLGKHSMLILVSPAMNFVCFRILYLLCKHWQFFHLLFMMASRI